MTDEWWAHPDYVEHAEQVLAGCPDSWDGDDSQESIIERYVHHLRDEVMRLGGCLRPFCFWADGDDCDHGYLVEPTPPRCPPACSEMHMFEPGCLAYVTVPDAGAVLDVAPTLGEAIDGLYFNDGDDLIAHDGDRWGI